MHIKNEADHANPCHAALGEGSCHTITDCHTRSGERDPERCHTHRPHPGRHKQPPSGLLGGLYIKKKPRSEQRCSPSAVPLAQPGSPPGRCGLGAAAPARPPHNKGRERLGAPAGA